jgi:hypothetical protein
MKLSAILRFLSDAQKQAADMGNPDPEVTFWDDNRAHLCAVANSKAVFVNMTIRADVADLDIGNHIVRVDHGDARRGDVSIPVSVLEF